MASGCETGAAGASSSGDGEWHAEFECHHESSDGVQVIGATVMINIIFLSRKKRSFCLFVKL